MMRSARHPIHRPSRLTLMAASALLLSACGTMIPPLKPPPLPVAAAYPTPTGTGQALADIAWQSFFIDERLKRLITLALDSNRDLRLAVLAIDQARTQLQVRQADLLPTVGAGVSASRTPGANGQTSSYTAGLQVSAWEIDFFGRIRSLGEAARAQVLATDESRKAVQISLVSAIAQTYLAIQADEALLTVTRQTLQTRQESMKLTQLKFDNGATSELDLRQAESLLEGANIALAQQTRQRALDENALVLLVGQPLPTDLPPMPPLGTAIDSTALAELPAGLPSDLLIRRPDIRAAEQQLIAANANIGAARAAFFPRVALTTSIGTQSREFSDLFSTGTKAWSFAPSITLPIFDAGRNQANLDSARAGREIAVAQYEKSIQSAFREVADALAGRETLTEQARALRATAEAESVRFRLSDLRYRNGVASSLDLLDAQRSLFSAQQSAVQAQLLELQNRVTLYRTLGGGWTERAPAQAPA